MITTIDITLLPADLQQLVRAKYRVALMDPERSMSYQEAAWLYGYSYMTIRNYTCNGFIKTVGRNPNKRITHAAMRNYVRRKKKDGAPRHALQNAQTELV